MPEAQITPLDTGNDLYRYTRKDWRGTGIDNFTNPPGQNPDRFLALTNIMPPQTNTLLRRWGYRSFKPKLDLGASIADDEATPSANAAAVLKARRLYDYENQTLNERTIIATASDGTGSTSITDKAIYWDANGTATTIFTPAAGARHPRLVLSRDYAYFLDGIAGDTKKWTLQWQYSLADANNASGGNTVYDAAAGSNLTTLQAGMSITITGFVTGANNGTFTVVSSTATSVTVNNAAGVAETHAATITLSNVSTKWGIDAPTTALLVGTPSGGGALSFALSAAANASGGNTVYTGTSLSTLLASTIVTIAGFVTGANNGTFTVVSSTSTTVTVNNPSGVAETHAATLTTNNRVYPTTQTNGWAANAHVGSYEGGVDQGFFFGLDSATTGSYTNPSNVFDGNESTYASATRQHTHAYNGCVWAFSALSTTLNNITLNVLSEVPTSGTDGQIVTKRSAGIYYTIDGGTTWVQVYDVANRPKQWDHIALPNAQDLSKVFVMAFLDGHDDMYHKVYEINIEGATVGNGPVTLFAGRRYYTVFGNSQTGHLSDLSPISPSTNAVSGGVIPLSGIPTSTDTQVDFRLILATADGGDPSVLYLLTEIDDNTTTVFQDGVPETDLILANTYLFTDDNGFEFGVVDNSPAPNGDFPTKHLGRIFMVTGQFIRYSKNIAELTTNTGIIAGRYEEAWPADNQLDISNTAEIAKGLLSDGQTLYVGTSRHIRRITGDSADTFSQPEIVFNEVGLVNQDVWHIVFLEDTPVGAMWLTPDYRVIISDFNTYRDVGTPIQTTLNTINKSADANSWASFFSDGVYNFYMLAIPTGVNTDPDTLCIFDLRMKEWFIWSLADSMISGLFYFNLGGVPRWLVVDSNGKIRLFDKTTARDREGDTTPIGISHTITTTWLDCGDPEVRKAINELEVETLVTGTLVSIVGASTAAEFNSPTTVRANVPLVANIFGDLKTFFVGYPAVDRFYKLTFTATSDGSSTPTDILLGEYSLVLYPIHRF